MAWYVEASLLTGAVSEKDTAQSGDRNTITLSGTSNGSDDYYNHMVLLIVSGKGIGQKLRVIDYNGTTKVATMEKPWKIVPDNTSVYVVSNGYIAANIFDNYDAVAYEIIRIGRHGAYGFNSSGTGYWLNWYNAAIEAKVI